MDDEILYQIHVDNDANSAQYDKKFYTMAPVIKNNKVDKDFLAESNHILE